MDDFLKKFPKIVVEEMKVQWEVKKVFASPELQKIIDCILNQVKLKPIEIFQMHCLYITKKY